MKNLKLFVLFIFTILLLIFLQFSHISVLYNIVKLLFVLTHFSLVVFMTDWLLSRQGNVRKLGVVYFGGLFIVTGIFGLWLFPTEEIGRLTSLEPFILIFGVLTLSVMRYIEKLDFKRVESGKRGFSSYKLLLGSFNFILVFFIIFSVFSPKINLAQVEGGYLPTVSADKVIYVGDPANRSIQPIIPFFEIKVKNILPISTYIPVDSSVRVCTFAKDGSILYGNTAIYMPAYYIEGVTKQWVDSHDSGVFGAIRQDPSVSGYDYWYGTREDKKLLKVSPFANTTVRMGVYVSLIANRDIYKTDQEAAEFQKRAINDVGAIKLFEIHDSFNPPSCNDSNPIKTIKFL